MDDGASTLYVTYQSTLVFSGEGIFPYLPALMQQLMGTLTTPQVCRTELFNNFERPSTKISVRVIKSLYASLTYGFCCVIA